MNAPPVRGVSLDSVIGPVGADDRVIPVRSPLTGGRLAISKEMLNVSLPRALL